MTSSTEATPAPPRWIAPWLALLAPLYVISPLALLAMPYLKRLPRTALWILGFYAICQQIPALFTPEPLLASGLALIRTLLMFGLIGVGVALGDVQRLKHFVLGLGVVFLVAIGYSLLGSLDFSISRLVHPYMTPITLGLAGACGTWMALFLSGTLLWRIPLGVVALLVLVLSGSRGPLAAALLGCVAGGMLRQSRKTTFGLMLGATLLASGFYVGDQLGATAVTRLSSADTTGRDLVWDNTLSIVRAFPIGGVGSYRLGNYLAPPGDHCTLFTDPQGTTAPCPVWVSKLGNPWLIAHNVTLQQLAETGPLGLLGLLILLGGVISATLRNQAVFPTALLSGLLLATINDNTLLVPSPFFAELFWIVGGVQLIHLNSLDWRSGVLAGTLALTLSVPILVRGVTTSDDQPTASLRFIHAVNQVSSTKDYTVAVQFDAPPGDYRAALNACINFCITLHSSEFKITNQTSPLLTFQSDLFSVRTQRVEIVLLPAKSSLKRLVIGQKSWSVHNSQGQP